MLYEISIAFRYATIRVFIFHTTYVQIPAYTNNVGVAYDVTTSALYTSLCYFLQQPQSREAELRASFKAGG